MQCMSAVLFVNTFHWSIHNIHLILTQGIWSASLEKIHQMYWLSFGKCCNMSVSHSAGTSIPVTLEDACFGVTMCCCRGAGKVQACCAWRALTQPPPPRACQWWSTIYFQAATIDCLLLENQELNNPFFLAKGKESEAKLWEIYGKYLIAFLFLHSTRRWLILQYLFQAYYK